MNNPNLTPEVQLRILEAGWPDECEVLGRKLTLAIINGGRQGSEIGDRRIAYADIVSTVAAAAAVLQTAHLLWTARRPAITTAALLEAIRGAMPQEASASGVDQGKAQTIVEGLIEQERQQPETGNQTAV